MFSRHVLVPLHSRPSLSFNLSYFADHLSDLPTISSDLPTISPSPPFQFYSLPLGVQNLSNNPSMHFKQRTTISYDLKTTGPASGSDTYASLRSGIDLF
ncbi:hypothetical protein L2E82_43629 [Cichorium intybus]|uniref:Uncharacterized protein n=1 Tax=Cichorium intybus TaxID=13427 RepID=A0ACB8ZP37_CICIN|nr:hypothetical protein L2E82_43629 [Cichorium intybus]